MPKIRTSHGPRGKKWKVCLGMLPVLNLEWLHFGQVTLSPLNTIQSFAQTSKTNSGIRYCLITLLASWYELGRRLPWRRMECQSCRFLENASLLEKDERKTNQTDEQQSQILELVELLWRGRLLAIASSTSCTDIPDKMAAVTFVASGPDTLVKSLW